MFCKKISNDQEPIQSDPTFCPQNQREITKYINRQQFTKGTRGKPNEQLNDHLFGKELFILFAASAFRKLSSIYVFSYFPFGFEGRIWDLIVSVPDHCLSFYFPKQVVIQLPTIYKICH